MKQGTILIVDDNRNILTTVKMLLENTFEHIVAIANPNNIPAHLREDKPDVVLLDMNFQSGINSGNEGLYWLGQIKKMRPQACPAPSCSPIWTSWKRATLTSS